MLARGECEAVMRAMMLEKKGQPMFTFDPSKASSAWPDGSYEATITKTEETRSQKNGDPMLVVSFDVYGAPGGPTKGQKRDDLRVYITAPTDPERRGSLFILEGICRALGIGDKFKSGKIDAKRDLVNANLIVNLETEESPQYGNQNRIKSFAPLKRVTAASSKPNGGGTAVAEDDDEVPF